MNPKDFYRKHGNGFEDMKNTIVQRNSCAIQKIRKQRTLFDDPKQEKQFIKEIEREGKNEHA